MAVRLLLLLAVLALVPATAAAESPADVAAELLEEAAIMHKLRDSMNAADPVGSDSMFGWQPGNQAHHCGWLRVQCAASGHVVALELGVGDPARPENADDPAVPQAKESAPPLTAAAVAAARNASGGPEAPRGPLLPELSRLRHLERLDMLQLWKGVFDRPLAGLPLEWFQPGAFPALKQLLLMAHSFVAPLPAIQPGALPALVDLTLNAPRLRARLPASWGADSAVLPSLKVLNLNLDVDGPLPPEWALGFERLEVLYIWKDADIAIKGYMERQADEMARLRPVLSPSPSPSPPPLGPAEGQGPLPQEWASGFQALRDLDIANLQLTGSLPDEWLTLTAFPSLKTLGVSNSSLSGPLPANLFSVHPDLTALRLSNNQLTGTLPAEWTSSQALQTLQLDRNRLSGPAFPPAWLEKGRFNNLYLYDLRGNSQLTGTLPANLPWPKLSELYLTNASINGTIPEAWCRTHLKSRTFQLSVQGTHVKPPKPSCLRLVKGYLDEPATLAEYQPKPATAATPWIVLAVVAPLAALAGAGGVGRLLWQRRAQRRRQQDPGGLELLPLVQRASRRDHLTSSANSGSEANSLSSELPTDLAAAGPAGRQRRVTALLQTRRRGIQMLPMEAVSDGMAHTLVSRLRAQAHSLQAASAGDAGTSSSARAGSPHLAAGSVHVLQSMAGQWRLATESLRVPQEALEFVASDRGDLVLLGTGTHAVVYLAVLKGQRVAVKAFELGPGIDSGMVWQEVALLRNCHHPRVVQLLGVAVEEELLLVAMELAERGSLASLLRDPAMQEELRWGARGRQLALDVAEALDYLHSELHMLHSDLKAANVLVSTDWRASLSDLGMAQIIAGSARTAVGFSRVYAAPEQLLGQRCTLAADMYSFGVLLAFLTSARHGDRRGEWRLPEAPEDCPEEVVGLVTACISPDPLARPTAAEALQLLRDTRA